MKKLIIGLILISQGAMAAAVDIKSSLQNVYCYSFSGFSATLRLSSAVREFSANHENVLQMELLTSLRSEGLTGYFVESALIDEAAGSPLRIRAIGLGEGDAGGVLELEIKEINKDYSSAEIRLDGENLSYAKLECTTTIKEKR